MLSAQTVPGRYREMLKQEVIVSALIVAVLMVAAAILFGSRYQHFNQARLDRWTAEVETCIPVGDHLICR